jgi:acylglycerol lipase
MLRSLLVASVLAACAHTPHLDLRPENPAPDGQAVGSFVTADGTKIFHRMWKPTAAQKGVLIIQHGLRDHSDNYDHLARRAAAQGFAVWAMDLRGHARSSGPRVAPNPWHDYVDDMHQFIKIVAEAEPGQPIFVMGHSMGGAIAALTVLDKQPAQVKGLILSAPVLNLGVPPFALAGVRLLGTIAPNLGVLKLDPSAFSTNPAIAPALVKDPLVEQGAGPARTAAGLAKGAADIWAKLDRLTMPVLALHGTIDKLTAPSGSRALIEHAPSTDKTLKIYDGFSHDLVHEPKGEQVENDILAWLDAHTGGAALAPTPIYQGALHGDPAGRIVALRLGGGIVGLPDANTGLFEMALHFSKKAPVGYGAALTLTASGDGFAAALMPVGASVRFGAGGLGVAGGISTLPGGFNLAIPVGAWLELPLGPLHATLDAQLDFRLTGDPPRLAPLSSDLAQAGLALRLPGNRAHWPKSFAGVGPYVRGALLDGGGDAVYQVTAGLQLYGAD